MAVMAKLSTFGKLSRSLAEKAGHQKLVAQYIQKELLEADDANLLDEEDMHIFGLNPLIDPLHLVCCNLCKKPVKTSQFAIHAELCRSLGIAEELLSEHDIGTCNRKPPRKERKKSVGKRATPTGGKDIFASDASQTAISCTQLDERVGYTSCVVEAKGALETIAGLSGDMIPLAKRPKLIAADTAEPSDCIQARRVTNIIHSRDPNTYVPAPLATKTYYSQRNNRLQAAISRMYYHCDNDTQQELTLKISEASTVGVFPPRQLDVHADKSHVHSALVTHNTNQIHGQRPALNLVEAGCQAPSYHVSPLPMIDAYTSEAADAGVTNTIYHPKSYSFSSDTGKFLG